VFHQGKELVDGLSVCIVECPDRPSDMTCSVDRLVQAVCTILASYLGTQVINTHTQDALDESTSLCFPSTY
jgi:hypothetical protein